jgi:hypothetical protein
VVRSTLEVVQGQELLDGIRRDGTAEDVYVIGCSAESAGESFKSWPTCTTAEALGGNAFGRKRRARRSKK